MGPRSVAFFLLCLCVCGACTLRSYALKHGDDLILWYAKRMVTLRGQQEEQLSQAVSKHWTQVRCDDLPPLLNELQEFASVYRSQGLTPQLMSSLTKRWDHWRVALLGRMSPDLVGLLLTFSAAQWQEVDEALRERREKWELLAATAQPQFSRDYEEQITEQFSKWYGSAPGKDLQAYFKTRAQQQEQVKKHVLQLADAHGHFTAYFRTKPKSADAERQLRTWIAEPASLRQGAAAEAYQVQRVAWQDSLRQVDALASPAQRQHLSEKITGLLADLEALKAATKKCPASAKKPATLKTPR